jgi:hypothetical protein
MTDRKAEAVAGRITASLERNYLLKMDFWDGLFAEDFAEEAGFLALSAV